MELYIFGRFHAREGQDDAVAAALREVIGPSRREPGCLAIEHFRSIRDPRLFYVHSRWIDEAAFETHAGLPHTVRFLEQVQPLIDHPLDVTRARPLDQRASQVGASAES
jgi:quinol monooxygenase YgiN